MATFTFGRAVDIHWQGYEVVGPAGTVFSIPDQLYDEFNDDIAPVEPTLAWVDTNEFQTLSNSVSVTTLTGTIPISVTSTTSGKVVAISSTTNPAGYNLVADGTGGVIFQAASTGALTSIVGISPMSTIIVGNTASVILNANYQTAGSYQPSGTYVTGVVGTSPISATGTTAITLTLNANYQTAGTYVNAVIGTSPASVSTASGTSTVSIVAGSIDSTHLSATSVGSSQLINGSVTSDKLGAASVVAAKIDAGAVGSAAISAGAVNSAAISAGSVNTSAINSGAATTSQVLTANGSGGASFQTVSAGISAATFTAKGNILTASASGVISVLGVGSDGTVLTADSNATSGIKYGSLAVLSSPSSSTILNGTSTPWTGPAFQTGNNAGRGKYATDGTTHATISNELLTSAGPGSSFVRAAYLSAILSGGAYAYTETTSIAYGNGIWVIAYKYSSQGYLRLAYSTDLSTWTNVSSSDVYSFAGGNMVTDIIYCDTSTGSKTFLWSIFSTNIGTQRMYAINADSTSALNAGMYQVWDQGTSGGSSQPIMTFSKLRNQWYALSSNPNNTQPALFRYGTPNGTSTTHSGSQDLIGSVYNNPYNSMMLTNDSTALYASVSNNWSTSTPYKISLPIGSSITVSNVSGTFGTRYNPGYWAQSGNKIAHFSSNDNTGNGVIGVTVLDISANTTTSYSYYEPGYSGNSQVQGKQVQLDENTNVYMTAYGSTWMVDPDNGSLAIVSKTMYLNGLEKFTHNGYIYHATKSSGLAGPADLYGWGLVNQPINTSQSSTLQITGATDHGNINIISSSSGQIWTSAATSNWTSRTSGFAGTPINSLSSNGTVAVAVGNTGKVSYSSDTAGSTWTIATSGTTQNLKQVAYGAGRFVAVGAAGTMIGSSNGTSWSSISGPFGTSAINTVVYHPRLALFAAAGISGLLATSSNGTSWVLRTTGAGEIFSIAVGLASFVIGYNRSGYTNQAFRISYDGITWTEIIISAYGLGYTDGYTGYSSGPTHGAYIMQYKYSSGGAAYYINKDYSDTLGSGSVIVL